jgi:hypothetical protein
VVIVKQETKQKGNKTSRNETKRNETQQKRNKIKQKRNEANQDKQNHRKFKKTKQTITKRFLFTWDNNPQNGSDGLKNLYNFRKLGEVLCSHLPYNVPNNLFRFSECLDPLLEQKTNISISVPSFAAWDL